MEKVECGKQVHNTELLRVTSIDLDPVSPKIALGSQQINILKVWETWTKVCLSHQLEICDSFVLSPESQ